MRVAIAISVLFFLPCCAVKAAFTDFSDYTQTESFEIDEVFQSGGLQFKALDLLFRGFTSAHVFVDRVFDFSVLQIGSGVEFLLPEGTQEISFDYGNGGGRLVLINGIEPIHPLDATLSFLDGMTIDGVSFSVIVDRQSIKPPSGVTSESGTLTLQGPIHSLTLGGVELSIDNVSVIVPEPATTALLLAAGITLIAARRTENR